MAAFEIPTERLRLVLRTPEEVLAWVESLPPEVRAEVSPDWVARVRVTPAGDPWSLSYDALERSSGSSVGGGTFKGPPDDEGVVEVAYGIDEGYRGLGYATEVARALTDFAFASGRVGRVRAHTLPGNGASARVLQKCGFGRVGQVVDPGRRAGRSLGARSGRSADKRRSLSDRVEVRRTRGDLGMAWVVLVIAGLFEVGWAIGLKYTDGSGALPTIGTVASMVVSLALLGVADEDAAGGHVVRRMGGRARWARRSWGSSCWATRPPSA
ncbi:MAG: GNAT family N-acetyltransferase [Isosphaeraceae bacterium]